MRCRRCKVVWAEAEKEERRTDRSRLPLFRQRRDDSQSNDQAECGVGSRRAPYLWGGLWK